MREPCPNCQFPFQFDERYFGRVVNCRVCNCRFCLPGRGAYVLMSWLGVFAGLGAVVLVLGGTTAVLWGMPQADVGMPLLKAVKEDRTPADDRKLDNLLAAPPETAQSQSRPVDPETAAAAKLGFARDLLAQGKIEESRAKLAEIVEHYPRTSSAGEARQLLLKLNQLAARGR